MLGASLSVSAADLTQVSDRVLNSAPGVSTDHIISFTVTNPVPAGGKIVITPEQGEFSLPNTFDYTDVDFLQATSSGNFTNRTLASLPSISEDGVLVSGLVGTTSTTSIITITLNSTDGLSPGDKVRLLLGQNATHQHVGNVQYINPSPAGAYRIELETRDASDSRIDTTQMLTVVIDPVTVDAYYVDVTPPFRFNGAPNGNLAPNTTNVEVTFRTNELAQCKYATSSDVTFADMLEFFTSATTSTHSRNFVTENGEAYNFYIRCRDYADNINDDDYLISFAIAAQPGSGATAGETGSGTGENTDGGGGGGSGTGTGGTSSGGGSTSGGGGGGGGGSSPISGGAPFPSTFASVRLIGQAYPFSTISVLQDGVHRQNLDSPIGGNGEFNILVSDLTRGTYSFGVYATGPDGVESSSYATTFTVIGDTVTSIDNIYVPPSFSFDKEVYSAGETITVEGYAPAQSSVDVWFHQQKSVVLDTDITKRTISADADGYFSTTFSSAGRAVDTYQVKARWIGSDSRQSDFSKYQYLGIGTNPDPEVEGGVGDLNLDTKINIVDFSILLFHWGSDGAGVTPSPDLNNDARVNLTDFSILIFHWTG